MRGSGKTRYKRIARKLGVSWTEVRDRELAGLTHEEKRDQDPLGVAEGRRPQRKG